MNATTPCVRRQVLPTIRFLALFLIRCLPVNINSIGFHEITIFGSGQDLFLVAGVLASFAGTGRCTGRTRTGMASPRTDRLPLKPVWSYRNVQSPAPAWPDQPKVVNWVDTDHAFQPVVAGGLVVFGSSRTTPSGRST